MSCAFDPLEAIVPSDSAPLNAPETTSYRDYWVNHMAGTEGADLEPAQLHQQFADRPQSPNLTLAQESICHVGTFGLPLTAAGGNTPDLSLPSSHDDQTQLS